jgi:hypothetical protein
MALDHVVFGHKSSSSVPHNNHISEGKKSQEFKTLGICRKLATLGRMFNEQKVPQRDGSIFSFRDGKHGVPNTNACGIPYRTRKGRRKENYTSP